MCFISVLMLFYYVVSWHLNIIRLFNGLCSVIMVLHWSPHTHLHEAFYLNLCWTVNIALIRMLVEDSMVSVIREMTKKHQKVRVCVCVCVRVCVCVCVRERERERVLCVFVCVEVLRPGRPNGVRSSAHSFPKYTITGQAQTRRVPIYR